MPLFRRRTEAAPGPEEPADRNAAVYVPASMRERPAPAVMADDAFDDDERDEEIEFLENLVGEIDRGDGARTDSATPSPRPRRADPADEMWAFREPAPRLDTHEGVRRHMATEVDLGDLLDELNVTAAALRRRRAA